MAELNISKYKQPAKGLDLSAYKKPKESSMDNEDDGLLDKAKNIAKTAVKIATNPVGEGMQYLGKNVGAGALSGVQNIGNNLADAVQFAMDKANIPGAERFKDQGNRADFYKMLGTEEAGFSPAGAAQALGKYAGPGELGAGISGAVNVGRAIPKIIEAMKYGKNIPGVLNNAVSGALMEMLGGDKPTSGSIAGAAAGGAVLPAVINKVLNQVKNIPNIPNNVSAAIKNYILSATEKEAAKGSAHTPEQTAENIKNNYTNDQGEMMPIDIGTATNMPATQSAYNAVASVPFSGASTNRNIIANQTADVAVKKAETALADAEKYAEDIRGLSAKDIEAHKQDIDKMREDYKTTNESHQALTQLVDKAPDVVHSMTAEVPKGTSTAEYVSNEAKKSFDKLRSDAKSDFDKLNEQNIEFNPGIPGEAKFPTYQAEKEALTEQKDSLTAMFGPNSDMPRAIIKEMDNANNLINHDPSTPIKLNEIRTHVSNLGKLWEQAKTAGADNAARMLQNMQRSLVNDTKTLLAHTGHSDALKLWNDANAKWSQSSQFYNSPAMRKVVGRKTTERGYIADADALAKELHSPNNANILAILPNGAQKAAGSLMITKGQIGKLNPKGIAKTFNSLTEDQFKAMASHSPEEAEYLKSLPEHMSNADKLAKAKKQLATTIDRIELPKGSELESSIGNIAKRKEQLEEAIKQRLKPNNIKSAGGSKLAKVATGTAGAALTAIAPGIAGPLAGLAGTGVLTSRAIQKLLTNPELINKYIKGEKFPKTYATESAMAKEITKFLTRNK